MRHVNVCAEPQNKSHFCDEPSNLVELYLVEAIVEHVQQKAVLKTMNERHPELTPALPYEISCMN